MRNDLNFSDTKKHTVYWEYSPGLWSKWQGPYYKGNKITRTFRSESTPTVKVGNEYQHFTQYRAFFFTSHTTPFVYYYTQSGRSHKVVGEGGASSDPFPYLMPYGCNSAYPHTPSIPGSIVSKCEAEVQNRIKSNDFDIGQSLGELPETLRFIALTLRDLITAYKLVRGGNTYKANKLFLKRRRNINTKYNIDITNTYKWKVGRPSKTKSQKFGSTSEAWLSLQYGWLPMMNDIYSAANLIRNGIANNASPMVKASRDDPFYSKPALYSVYDGFVDGTFERGCEVGVRFNIANQTLYDLDRYGLLDPLSLAWELVPLSFVVDWFTGAGDFIDSWTRPIGLAFREGYITRYCNNQFEVGYYLKGNTWTGGNLPVVSAKMHSSWRDLYLTWPHPAPYLTLDVGTPQVLSVIALAKALS